MLLLHGVAPIEENMMFMRIGEKRTFSSLPLDDYPIPSEFEILSYNVQSNKCKYLVDREAFYANLSCTT